MVLVERNTENVRNGRRSRGPSPNGHGGTPESSSDDDSTKKIGNKSTKQKSEYEEKIRVGRDYQVICPDLVPLPDRKPEMLNDRALLVWSPTKDIPEMEEYISVAKEKYGYNGEQALGMLFWHKHDLERAVLDLANFTPFPDEWTVEDKVLFEQAFQFHGKSFHRIRQMLPDKSIASLVKYYYSWKKTRSRTSVMDRQEKIKAKEGSENGSENGSNEESDTEEKKWPLHRGIHRASGSPPRTSNDEQSTSTPPTNQATSGTVNGTDANTKEGTDSSKQTATNSVPHSSMNSCFGCGVACNQTNLSPHGALCSSCFHHWRRTGALRPTSGPCFGKRSRGSNGFERHKRKPPRGMYINHDDIVSLACPENDQTNPNRNDLLGSMDREISSVLSQIQTNKQIVSTLKRKNSELVEDIRPPEIVNRINSRWNNEELLLAVQGVRRFGKDFQGIADMIGTKTEAQVRTFFVNYRRRYNLDNMLKEFEANFAQKQQQLEEQQPPNSDVVIVTRPAEPEIMEIDLDDENQITLNNKDNNGVVEELSLADKASSGPPEKTIRISEPENNSNQSADTSSK